VVADRRAAGQARDVHGRRAAVHQIWNDLLVALLFLQNLNERTVTVGLASAVSGRVTSVPILMAGSVMSVIPPIIVYLLFQKHLVRGITLGVGK